MKAENEVAVLGEMHVMIDIDAKDAPRSPRGSDGARRRISLAASIDISWHQILPGLSFVASGATCLSGTTRHDFAAALAAELLDRTAYAESANHLDQIEIVQPDSAEKLTEIRSKRLQQILSHGPWSFE